MSRELVHIYGPISIQTFGLIVTIGLLVFTWLIRRRIKHKKLMTEEQFSHVLFVGILSGIVGGRLLYVAQEYHTMTSFWQVFSFWEGGFSILGTILSILIAETLYLRTIRVSVLQVFDIAALYAPLFQSIARTGCFFAGCCYGIPSTLPWAIQYTDAETIAPVCTQLHPTQLYSSTTLFFIFLFMLLIGKTYCKKNGQLITLYLMLASAERFTVDFWRGDRAFFKHALLRFLSIHQWIALGLAISAGIAFVSITLKRKPQKR